MADPIVKDAAPAAPAPSTPKTLVYCGPTKPVPSVGNLPGLPAYMTVKADLLTPEQIEFVKKTVPAAASWWK